MEKNHELLLKINLNLPVEVQLFTHVRYVIMIYLTLFLNHIKGAILVNSVILIFPLMKKRRRDILVNQMRILKREKDIRMMQKVMKKLPIIT